MVSGALTQAAAKPQTSGAIHLDLVLPVIKVGFGIFAIDPVEQMIGMPIAEALSLLLHVPVHKRPSAAGAAVDVYPLALPEGGGAAVPLGRFGELDFKNRQGPLILTVPLQA